MNALNHSRPLALFGLLLANLCWSGNALVARAFAGEIAPFTLSFWRWCLALALLLPFVAMPLWRHRVAVRTAGWRLLVLGGNILPLIGHELPQRPAVLRQFNQEGRTIPMLASWGLPALMRQPRAKPVLWRTWLEWTAA